MQSQKRKRKQAGRTNSVTVRVFANRVGKKVTFTHDWAANGRSHKDPPIDLPHDSGPWDIDLQLHDFTGLGLGFECASASDVMWVHDGTGCPPKKGTGGGHVKFKSVGNTGPNPADPLDLLHVSDDNQGAPCDLHFLLRFKTRRGKGYNYDPIIRNRGTN